MSAIDGPAQSPLVRACWGKPVPFTPVWFMRQAGRSLPEYRTVRAGLGMLESCRRPDLVCEITLQPVRRHGVDAAILFSDIVVPLAAAGVNVEIISGTGPVIANPVRESDDLRQLDNELDLGFVTESVQLLRAELGATPLIGFAGAPFTLASYLVEGGPSRHHTATKTLMYARPDLWHALCNRLATITLRFLQVQVQAGAAAIQLFDSWAGALSESDYQRYVQPYSARVLAGLADLGVPRIHFGVNTGELLPAMAEAGADVMGVDWRTPLDQAVARLGGSGSGGSGSGGSGSGGSGSGDSGSGGPRPVQGNLDPAVLFGPWDVVEREVRRILAEGASAPGHIFNLGHGVLPETDPEVLRRVVDLVHEVSQA